MALELSKNQQVFVSALSKATGLDPNVVAAWVRNEEPAANATVHQNDQNWLNVGNVDSGQRLGIGNKYWSDPTKAALATAAWMRGTPDPGFGIASPQIQNILKTVGQGPAAQIAAIQYHGPGGWSTGGETALPDLYREASGKTVTVPVSNGGSGASAANANPYSALVSGPATYQGPDQGIDFTGSGGMANVKALGAGRVTDVDNGTSSWPGGGEVVYQLTSGPNRGKYVYTTESIRSNLKEGQNITQGQNIGSFKAQYPGIESGFARGPQGGAYGLETAGKTTPADPHALAYRDFVQSLSKQGVANPALAAAATKASVNTGPKASDLLGMFGTQDATSNPAGAKTWTDMSTLLKSQGK